MRAQRQITADQPNHPTHPPRHKTAQQQITADRPKQQIPPSRQQTAQSKRTKPRRQITADQQIRSAGRNDSPAAAATAAAADRRPAADCPSPAAPCDGDNPFRARFNPTVRPGQVSRRTSFGRTALARGGNFGCAKVVGVPPPPRGTLTPGYGGSRAACFAFGKAGHAALLQACGHAAW